MELKDTVKGMLSDNYKERMLAEYQQILIREWHLADAVAEKMSQFATDAVSMALGKEASPDTSDIGDMYFQLSAMESYRMMLGNRLKNNGIPVPLRKDLDA